MNKIDIEDVVKSKLGLEAYFILYCLYFDDKKLLMTYVNECKKINTSVFLELETEGFVKIKPYKNEIISYELLSLTPKSKQLIAAGYDTLRVTQTVGECDFEGFRTFYPTQVRDGFKVRRLHGNLKKCRSLYEKLLMETTHEILCNCAKLYYEEKVNSKSEWYMQNLETWLNQKNYLQYVEEATKLGAVTPATKINDQSEDI